MSTTTNTSHSTGQSHSTGRSHSSGNVLNQRQTLLASASVPVSEKLIGSVVGKKGVTIIKIKNDTRTRISHLKPDPGNGHLFNSFHITGSPHGVDKARRWILSIIGNTYKTDHPEEFTEDESKN